jgi:hypothetical protein
VAYLTVDDLRREGVSDEDYTTEYVQERIDLASKTVERLLGLFFEPKVGHVVTMSGPGHDTLFLPYPPTTTSAITEITVGGTAVDSEYWEVIMPEFPDGRLNPKILHLTGSWTAGKRNVIITGTFGFVEADGTSIPPEIHDLCKRVAIWGMPKLGDTGALKADRIVEESIEGYRYKLSEVMPSGTFDDPKIDSLLARFHRPAMGTI